MDFKFDPIFSDLEMLLSLKPEELAGFLIVNLNSGSTDKLNFRTKIINGKP